MRTIGPTGKIIVSVVEGPRAEQGGKRIFFRTVLQWRLVLAAAVICQSAAGMDRDLISFKLLYGLKPFFDTVFELLGSFECTVLEPLALPGLRGQKRREANLGPCL
eukprot:scaffold171224_cov15-Prasinocladus_malaysianus.AAC.1